MKAPVLLLLELGLGDSEFGRFFLGKKNPPRNRLGCPAGSELVRIVSVCWFITHLFMGRIQPIYIGVK